MKSYLLTTHNPKLTTVLRKAIALLTAISFLAQSFIPTKVYALTGGPSAPEFSNFESVSTTNMVDPFTGDFTYNIPLLEVPGPNGGGYPISLSYHSGSGPEDEASWVGYGWTLNPGAINRNKRGFPDDICGGAVKNNNKLPRNFTASLGYSIEGGADFLGEVESWDIGATASVTYNNQKGLSYQVLPYANFQLGLKTTTVTLQNDMDFTLSYSYQNPILWGLGIIGSSVTAAHDILEFHQGRLTEKLEVDKILKTQGTIKTLNTIGTISKWTGFGATILTPSKGTSSSHYGAYSLENKCLPYFVHPYQTWTSTFQLGLSAGYSFMGIGLSTGTTFFGTFNTQKTKYIGNSYDEEYYRSNLYYGFLYTQFANVDGKGGMMDYSCEKNEPANFRDKYLPIPFAAADDFSVEGEGLSGIFRAYSSKIMQFHPYSESFVNSNSGDLTFGVSVDISSSPSVSLTIGNTDYSFGIHEWNDEGENDEYDFDDNEDDSYYYFRFKGDLGGYSSYNNDGLCPINYSTGSVPEVFQSGSDKDFNPVLSSNTELEKEITGSSFIGYHTVKDMMQKDVDGKRYNRFSYRWDIDEQSSRTTESEPVYDTKDWHAYGKAAESDQQNSFEKSIGEFSIVNKGGLRYNYSLPVYNKNESNIMVKCSSADTDDNTIAYTSITNNDKKIGDEIAEPYATTFLLTEILGANYIDKTMNGPSEDDYGAWTRFNYEKAYGANNNESGWFHWRAPYTGLLYNPGRLSDPDDDMGSYSSGDKEVYYLKSIETKTHKAVFELEERLDGMDAAEDETASLNDDVQGTHMLKRLKSITLYAKDEDGNLGSKIETVYFQYDYSLKSGMPNFYNGANPEAYDSEYAAGDGTGVLSLKKIWFEYDYVHNAQISPYEFIYEYPTIDYPSNPKYELVEVDDNNDGTSDRQEWQLKDEDGYDDFENYGQGLTENPSYSTTNSDPWGNYRENGDSRAQNYEVWVDQKASNSFDPAAWNLKQIKLPTGAQLHIQYEQDDYQFVQDRKAMAMVSIELASDSYGTEFYLNLNDIGITEEEDILETQKWIEQVLRDGYNGREPEKIYFKFKYNINSSCGNEFIDGYASVNEVSIENSKIKLNIGNKEYNGAQDGYETPCEACREYYKANVGVSTDGECGFYLDNPRTEEQEQAAGGYSVDNIFDMAFQLIDMSAINDDANSTCTSMDEDHSYVRVPLPYEKKGGGIRVKRILTYDAGIEGTGEDAVLYGSEYVYQDYNGNSSGVATNESTSANREENALIGLLMRRELSSKEQILCSGEDNTQFQGPIGEYVLPAPMVGYSRVIIKNIHSGSTSPGFTTNEYYTSYDFPFDKPDFSTEEDESPVKESYSGVLFDEELKMPDKTPVISDPVYSSITGITNTAYWTAQSYRFVLTNMNGQLKKTSHYDGSYNDVNNEDKITELSSTEYDYFDIGEEIPVMYDLSTFDTEPLGKETEIVTNSQFVYEVYDHRGVTFVFQFGIPPFYAYPSITMDKTFFRTFATNKIIYFPAVVKSITSYQDGSSQTITNKQFDPYSGDVLVTETSGLYDQLAFDNSSSVHNGKYINWSFPASFYYDGVKSKFLKESAVREKLTYNSGSDIYSLSNNETEENYFSLGDLVAVTNESDQTDVFHVSSITDDFIYLTPTSNFSYNNITNGSRVTATIIQSGKTNQLSTRIGGLTTYGEFQEPYVLGSGANSYYTIDNVLSASAMNLTNDIDYSSEVKNTYDISSTSNAFETGEINKWHAVKNYVYKGEITHKDDGNNKVYESGLLTAFRFFDWVNEDKNDGTNWLMLNQSEEYSPNGDILEERNLLDIYSSIKMGYDGSLLYLAANNADYGSVHFESFENQTESCGEDLCFEEMGVSGHTLSTDNAHTGSNSLLLEFSTVTNEGTVNTYTHTSSIPLTSFKRRTSQESSDGISVKVWVKSDNTNISLLLRDASAYNALSDVNTDAGDRESNTDPLFSDVTFQSVARTGEWELFEAKIDNWSGGMENYDPTYSLEIQIQSTTVARTAPEILIDDVRVQPLNSKMTAYVYDPETYRILASLDDQNFALLYQYNDEGKLIRKQKETIRGVKTLVETQYNIPTQERE